MFHVIARLKQHLESYTTLRWHLVPHCLTLAAVAYSNPNISHIYMSMSYHHHRTEINFMCYYGLSNAFKCKWSENNVCGIISVAMVTYANFTEVLEIQISLLVISISLNLKVQSPITASRFTGAQRMLCATPLKKSAITIYVIIHLHLALDYPYSTCYILFLY